MDSSASSTTEVTARVDLGDLDLNEEAKRRVERILQAALEAELNSQPSPQGTLELKMKIVW